MRGPKPRRNYAAETAQVAKILRLVAIDPVRSDEWKDEVVRIGELLIRRLNAPAEEAGERKGES